VRGAAYVLLREAYRQQAWGLTACTVFRAEQVLVFFKRNQEKCRRHMIIRETL